MIIKECSGIHLYQFQSFRSHKKLVHAVTCKETQSAASFSMSLKNPFGKENREKVCEVLHLPAASLVAGRQVHGNSISLVQAQDKGRGGLSSDNIFPQTDGLITKEREMPILAISADCPLIALFDPIQNAIAVVHAGWRGTVLQIAIEAVQRMKKEFSSQPQNLLAGIAPSIGPCCYEVGEEVIEKVKPFPWGQGTLLPHEEHTHFDLWQANIRQLLMAGLTEDHIECSQICTRCQHDRFFSYRMDGPNTGHIALFMSLTS